MVGSSRGGWAVLWYVADAIIDGLVLHFEVYFVIYSCMMDEVKV